MAWTIPADERTVLPLIWISGMRSRSKRTSVSKRSTRTPAYVIRVAFSRLGVRRHHAFHEPRQFRDQRLHVGGREVPLSHGSPARRRSRALPWARGRRASG